MMEKKSSIKTSHSSTSQDIRHENDNSSTAHQFSCCVHRLKRPRTSPNSPGPQPGTLGTASGADDAVDVWAIVRSCRRAPRTAAAVSLSLILPYYKQRADTMFSTRRARSVSGCRRRSLGVETTSASCTRRDGTCWEMVAVA